MDGLEICKRLKREPQTAAIPIVMLTARNEEADVVTGLELGADDYLTKPFSPRVLAARVKAVLRRQQALEDREAEVITRGNLVIHPGHHEVRINNQSVPLTPTEFRILQLLAQRPGWVFSRYQIVDGARGDDAGVTERSVDVHIAALRRKLGGQAGIIETVRGVGYRLRG
jgi:two-component system phosphate regulon response regulator PhoB